MKPQKQFLILLLSLLFLMPLKMFSQHDTVGQMELNAGIGFGTSWINDGYYSIIPPLTFSLDYALRDDWGPGVFSVGGCIGISRYAQERSWNNSGTYEYYGYKYTSTIFAARITYHYELFKGFDTYIGGMAGFRINSNNDYGVWPPNIDESFDTDANLCAVGRMFLGGKYFFSPKIAAFGELGYGMNYFTIGLSVKL